MSKTLNDIMELDAVVEIGPDGEPTERLDLHAPDVYQELDDEGSAIGEPTVGGDWELLTGFTGQYGYRGAALHSSEYVGGGLERHIRANPGLYVATTVTYLGPEEEYDPDSWVVAFRPLGHDDDRHTECNPADCEVKRDVLQAAEAYGRVRGSTECTYSHSAIDDNGIRYTRASVTWTREDHS